jgi:hypothetical protein
MTFQPPPPPPGGNPPPAPPPPGQWGPPPGGGYPASRPGFDPTTVNPLDWGILAAGVLAFIFSLFDYYTVTVSFGGASASASASAWHGFFGWFAAIVALAAAVVVAIELFAPQVRMPFAARLIGLVLFAVATLCVIIALFVWPGGNYDGPGVDEGHGFGYWASLIVIIAGLVMSLMRAQQTGTQLPGALNNLPNIGARGPQGGMGGPHGGVAGPPVGGHPAPPPPPPGYGPPPGP